MEEIVNFGNYLTSALLIIAGGVATVMMLIVGYLWMFSTGDPARVAKAKAATFAVFVGMIVAGAAFMLPRVIVTQIIEPSGGRIEGLQDSREVLRNQQAAQCDQILRNRLEAWQGPATHRHIKSIIALMKRGVPGCDESRWTLRLATGSIGDGSAGWRGAIFDACFEVRTYVQEGSTVIRYNVENDAVRNSTALAIYADLFEKPGGGPDGHPVRRSEISRNAWHGQRQGSILLYFDGSRRYLTGDTWGLPASGAACWYLNRYYAEDEWVESEPMPYSP